MAIGIYNGHVIGAMNPTIVTDYYDESKTYNAGDLCLHNFGLYVCKGSTTGVFDDVKWEETSAAKVLASMEESLDKKISDSSASADKITESHVLTFESSMWLGSDNDKYPYKNVLRNASVSEWYGTGGFIPQYVDIIPADGTAFFSDAEEAAKGVLCPNMVFDVNGVTIYSAEALTIDVSFRVGGVV